MTMRAGSYDANFRPDFRGIIRNDSYGWFRCTHKDHVSTRQARACATQALPAIRTVVDVEHAKVTGVLPEGWEIIP
jgi:hypothetical protein